jgi:hypothetical protein
VAVEKRFVNADVLERDNTFVLVDLENTIDQEKRISMRKNPHDLCNAEFVHYLPGVAGGFVAGGVAGAAPAGFGAAGVGAAAAAGFDGVASIRRMISVVISATGSA